MDSLTGMMHSWELFIGRTRKRLTDLEAENLKDTEVTLKGMHQSAVEEKWKTIKRDELAESLIPRDFEETLSLQSGVGSVLAKK